MWILSRIQGYGCTWYILFFLKGDNSVIVCRLHFPEALWKRGLHKEERILCWSIHVLTRGRKSVSTELPPFQVCPFFLKLLLVTTSLLLWSNPLEVATPSLHMMETVLNDQRDFHCRSYVSFDTCDMKQTERKVLIVIHRPQVVQIIIVYLTFYLQALLIVDSWIFPTIFMHLLFNNVSFSCFKSLKWLWSVEDW